jgi:NAD(P)-dependent dehydrogenase (short-subunit alcohol dehydrogenase family)
MKKYVIIGGSSGIGLHLVKQLAQDKKEIVSTYLKV